MVNKHIDLSDGPGKRAIDMIDSADINASTSKTVCSDLNPGAILRYSCDLSG